MGGTTPLRNKRVLVRVTGGIQNMSIELSKMALASVFLCTSSNSERLAMAFSVDIVDCEGAPPCVPDCLMECMRWRKF